MTSRQTKNKEILNILQHYIDKYPDMRFCQLLYMLKIMDNSDKFYEESDTTLNNIKDGFTK